MSTRANVVIKDDYNELWFYRHSDGYPQGTLPTLEKFLNWVKEKKIRDNVGQAAGWLIIIGAEEYKSEQLKECDYDGLTEEEKIEWGGKIVNEPLRGWKVGAYEPTVGRHGDIDYLYTIDLVKKKIRVEKV